MQKTQPIIKITPDGERMEIPPHIWRVMHGTMPRYLEEEEEALRFAEKLGWKADSKDEAPPLQLGSEVEEAEIHRIMRIRGLSPEKIERLLENGGGTLPGFYGKAKANSGSQTGIFPV
jgi:hypothetical protein